MNTKGFVLLLAAILVLGGSLGGAFFGGIALGKSQGEEALQSSLSVQSTSSAGQQFSGQFGQFRERIQSGEISQEELAEFRQEFQGQFGQATPGEGALGGGFARGAGVMGVIEKVVGNMVTVNTPQGSLQATISSDTTIQTTTSVKPDYLIEGMRVTVNGERGEGSTVEARSIFVIPEGAEGFFGGFRGDRAPGGRVGGS